MSISPQTHVPVPGGVPAAVPPRPELFVLSTPHPAGVLDFYRHVTGWVLESIATRPLGEVSGEDEQVFLVREGSVGWLPFLAVADLPAVLGRAQAAGGRVVFPLPDDDTRRAAAVIDPSDTRLGLYEGATRGSSGPRPLDEGLIVWMEQKTRNQDAATAFLSEVFGFTAVGPSGPGIVRLLQADDGSAYGGVMQFDDRWAPDHPPHWLLYMSTDDLDRTLDLATRHGGSVWFTPVQTPLGRLAYIRDPAGNALAVVEVAPGARALLTPKQDD